MRHSFFDSIRLLFPSSTAWNITQQKNMRKLLAAIAVLPNDLRNEIEAVYMDYFPETTRSLEKWEQVFQVIFTQAELSLRRSVLAGLWQMNNNGGAAVFLRKVLQEVWPELQLVENIPVGNPRGPNAFYYMVCGNESACCGNAKAVCGYRYGDAGYDLTILRNDTASSYSIPNGSMTLQRKILGRAKRKGTKKYIKVRKPSTPFHFYQSYRLAICSRNSV